MELLLCSLDPLDVRAVNDEDYTLGFLGVHGPLLRDGPWDIEGNYLPSVVVDHGGGAHTDSGGVGSSHIGERVEDAGFARVLEPQDH